ncbi:hypothetical protein JXQ70_13855 [bacterium]|nr:hypothetical protein [bacterium]
MNDNARALVGGDYKIYVGGDFTLANEQSAEHCAVCDESNWQALGTGTDSWVSALTWDGQYLDIGGLFLQAGPTYSSYIARWGTQVNEVPALSPVWLVLALVCLGFCLLVHLPRELFRRPVPKNRGFAPSFIFIRNLSVPLISLWVKNIA